MRNVFLASGPSWLQSSPTTAQAIPKQARSGRVPAPAQKRRTIAAIDQARPASHDALARIPGLGPAKIARFGDDLIALVRFHANR